jgi:hypothetical protein
MFGEENIMRPYSINSHEAMARLIALSMLVDGGLDKSELDVMASYGVLERLNMSEARFEDIVHHLCEDMLQYSPSMHHGQIELDERCIDAILAEIQDSTLRKFLLRVMLAVVDADKRMSDGEAILISRALQNWELDLVEVGSVVFSSTPELKFINMPPTVGLNMKESGARTESQQASILATHF